jgi:hypothetical protein
LPGASRRKAALAVARHLYRRPPRVVSSSQCWMVCFASHLHLTS